MAYAVEAWYELPGIQRVESSRSFGKRKTQPTKGLSGTAGDQAAPTIEKPEYQISQLGQGKLQNLNFSFNRR